MSWPYHPRPGYASSQSDAAINRAWAGRPRVICPECGGPTILPPGRDELTCADGHPRVAMVPYEPKPSQPVRGCKHCGEPCTGSWCSESCRRAEDGPE